jgi:hypothetical protein
MKRGLAGLLVALGAAGCGGGSTSAVSVSAKVSGSGTALTVAPSKVTVTRARIAVGGLSATGNASDHGHGGGSMAGGCQHMGQGSESGSGQDRGHMGGHHGGARGNDGDLDDATGSVLDLSATDLTGGTERALSTLKAQAGAYSSLAVAVAPLPIDAASTEELAQSGASAIIEGTYQGNAFRWVGQFQASQAIAGAELVDGANAITLNVDPSTWFVDADGTQLDPADATQAARIADSICASLHLSDATHPAATGRGAACVSSGL